MLIYIVRRLLYMIPILLGVSIICFSLAHLAPGGLLNAVVPADAPQQVVNQLRKDYALDKPIPIQYAVWLGHALRGNLGVSIATGRPVGGEVATALFRSLFLAAAAVLIFVPFGLLWGALAGYYAGNPIVDKLASVAAITGVSVPYYWLGLVLIIIFSVKLRVLPAMGAGAAFQSVMSLDWEHVRFVVLPSITLAMVPMGVTARTTRAVVAETLTQEFIQALYAKGLPRHQIFLHVAKNAAPTVLVVIGLQFVVLLGGSILVETVFSWPGTGFLMYNAIFQRDLPVLQGTLLVLSLLFVTINLVVDVIQTFLDPRIRRS